MATKTTPKRAHARTQRRSAGRARSSASPDSDTPARRSAGGTRSVASARDTRKTKPSRAKRLGLVDSWAETIRREVAGPNFQRDPEFLKKLIPLMEIWGRYFDAEVRGWENIPKSGPMMLVGNHSGGALTPDTAAVMAGWYRQRGFAQPLIGLAFDTAFGIPGFRDLMRKIGQVPASWENVGKALDEGAAVLVYPGGVHEVYRPWKDRDKVDFGGHKGFIRVALEKQVPIVPIVGHGGHHTLVVLTRGEKLAKLLRMERIRMKTYPILLQIPWGISPALPGVPLPAKVTVQILKPIDWRKLGPKAATDPKIIERCYTEITTQMQAAMDALAKETPHPLRARLKKLVARR
ncbi:MAG: lysophospholipid acyltransferase family protein [bacterium]